MATPKHDKKIKIIYRTGLQGPPGPPCDDCATADNQTNGEQKTQIVDSLGNVVGTTSNALDVNIKSGISITVDLNEATDSIAVFGNDGTTNRALKTDADGNLQVDVLSAPLPAGAATSAKQDTGNLILANIDSKTPALVLGKVPVDTGLLQPLTDAQLRANPVPVTVPSIPLPSGASTFAAQTDGSQKTQVVDGSGNVIGATDNALDVNIKSGSNINANVTGDITPSGLRFGGRITEVLLSTTEWTALPPGGPLVNRNAINIQNYSGDEIRLQFDNTILGFFGTIVLDQSERNYDIKDSILIYAKAKTGGATIVVEEIS